MGQSFRTSTIVSKSMEIAGSKVLFGDPTSGFDKLEANLAGQVLEAYGEFSGVQLSALTHQPSSPWYRTWHEGGGNAVISNDMLREHFLEMADDEE